MTLGPLFTPMMTLGSPTRWIFVHVFFQGLPNRLSRIQTRRWAGDHRRTYWIHIWCYGLILIWWVEGITNRPYIWNRYLHFRILKFPLTFVMIVKHQDLTAIPIRPTSPSAEWLPSFRNEWQLETRVFERRTWWFYCDQDSPSENHVEMVELRKRQVWLYILSISYPLKKSQLDTLRRNTSCRICISYSPVSYSMFILCLVYFSCIFCTGLQVTSCLSGLGISASCKQKPCNRTECQKKPSGVVVVVGFVFSWFEVEKLMYKNVSHVCLVLRYKYINRLISK